MHTNEWQSLIMTTGTVALKPEQCIYFFVVCSDEKINIKIEPLGVIGEHFRQRELQQKEQVYKNLGLTNTRLKKDLEISRQKVAKLEDQIYGIKNSKSWKLTRKLQRISHSSHSIKNKMKAVIHRSDR